MRRSFRLGSVLVLVTALAGVPAVAGAQSGSVSDAEARRDAAAAAAQEAAQDYEAAYARYWELDNEIAQLRADIEQVEADTAGLRDLAAQRAVEAYMGVRNDFSTVIDVGEDALEAVRRSEFLERVNAEGVDAVDRLGAINDDLAAREADLQSTIANQEGVVAELDALSAQLQERLAEADAALVAAREEQARREREAAERAAAARASSGGGSSSGGSTSGGGGGSTSSGGGGESGGSSAPPVVVSGGGLVCPVAGATSFTDTWGAPRSGGRRHEGVDLLANFGTALVAAIGGTISQSTSGLGGNQIWLHGNDGNTYFYAHLQSYTGGPRSVSAGEQIGTVGDTGNARGTPHLHWEVHPGGGGAVNPYPYAAAAC